MCLQRSPLVLPRAAGSSSPRRKQNIWKRTHWVWKPCNPLKSHKTAKDFFGKAWRKTTEIWKSLEKSLEAVARPRTAPFRTKRPMPHLRAEWESTRSLQRSIAGAPGIFLFDHRPDDR